MTKPTKKAAAKGRSAPESTTIRATRQTATLVSKLLAERKADPNLPMPSVASATIRSHEAQGPLAGPAIVEGAVAQLAHDVEARQKRDDPRAKLSEERRAMRRHGPSDTVFVGLQLEEGTDVEKFLDDSCAEDALLLAVLETERDTVPKDAAVFFVGSGGALERVCLSALVKRVIELPGYEPDSELGGDRKLPVEGLLLGLREKGEASYSKRLEREINQHWFHSKTCQSFEQRDGFRWVSGMDIIDIPDGHLAMFWLRDGGAPDRCLDAIETVAASWPLARLRFPEAWWPKESTRPTFGIVATRDATKALGSLLRTQAPFASFKLIDVPGVEKYHHSPLTVLSCIGEMPISEDELFSKKSHKDWLRQAEALCSKFSKTRKLVTDSWYLVRQLRCFATSLDCVSFADPNSIDSWVLCRGDADIEADPRSARSTDLFSLSVIPLKLFNQNDKLSVSSMGTFESIRHVYSTATREEFVLRLAESFARGDRSVPGAVIDRLVCAVDKSLFRLSTSGSFAEDEAFNGGVPFCRTDWIVYRVFLPMAFGSEVTSGKIKVADLGAELNRYTDHQGLGRVFYEDFLRSIRRLEFYGAIVAHHELGCIVAVSPGNFAPPAPSPLAPRAGE